MYVKEKEEDTIEEKFTVNFSQFCQETSLHGWKFFYYKKFHPCQVLFWILVIFCMVALVGYFISIELVGKIMMRHTLSKISSSDKPS